MKTFYYIFFIFLVGCNHRNVTTSNFIYNDTGHITIPLSLNDSTIYFIFDTAFDRSSVDESCGLSASDEKIVMHLPLAQDTANKYMSETINVSVVAQPSICTKFIIDNSTPTIIGTDIITKYHWLFDFDRMQVSVSPRRFHIANIEHYISIPYEEKDGLFYSKYPLTCIGKEQTLIDTGMVSEFTTDNNRYKALLLFYAEDQSEYQKLEERLMRHTKALIESESQRYHYVLDSLDIGGSIIPRTGIPLQINKYMPANSQLTVDFFKRFHQMYIDTNTQAIYVQ